MEYLIYVVDDEKNIRVLIKKYLEFEGFKVKLFELPSQVIDSLKNEKPDMLILDITMPEMDGYSLCTEVRKSTDAPIIFVSARDDEFDKILGLEIGGDDYLAKPFSPRELVARVKVIFKRTSNLSRVSTTSDKLQYGNTTLDLKGRKFVCEESKLELTSKEFDVLRHLLENKGTAFSREVLLKDVWNWDFVGNDRAVDDLIKRLRKKLVSVNSQIEIKTVRGYGYMIEERLN